MVKDKGENRTLQYQQTLVSFGMRPKTMFPVMSRHVWRFSWMLVVCGRRMELQLLLLMLLPAQLCPVRGQQEICLQLSVFNFPIDGFPRKMYWPVILGSFGLLCLQLPLLYIVSLLYMHPFIHLDPQVLHQSQSAPS